MGGAERNGFPRSRLSPRIAGVGAPEVGHTSGIVMLLHSGPLALRRALPARQST